MYLESCWRFPNFLVSHFIFVSVHFVCFERRKKKRDLLIWFAVQKWKRRTEGMIIERLFLLSIFIQSSSSFFCLLDAHISSLTMIFDVQTSKERHSFGRQNICSTVKGIPILHPQLLAIGIPFNFHLLLSLFIDFLFLFLSFRNYYEEEEEGEENEGPLFIGHSLNWLFPLPLLHFMSPSALIFFHHHFLLLASNYSNTDRVQTFSLSLSLITSTNAISP